jgi:hypothetical protein
MLPDKGCGFTNPLSMASPHSQHSQPSRTHISRVRPFFAFQPLSTRSRPYIRSFSRRSSLLSSTLFLLAACRSAFAESWQERPQYLRGRRFAGSTTEECHSNERLQCWHSLTIGGRCSRASERQTTQRLPVHPRPHISHRFLPVRSVEAKQHSPFHVAFRRRQYQHRNFDFSSAATPASASARSLRARSTLVSPRSRLGLKVPCRIFCSTGSRGRPRLPVSWSGASPA